MPHFVKHSNQLQDGIQPVRLFSVRALIHIHRTRSIIHWQFFWCSCDCNLQMNRPCVFIVSVLRDKNNWARTSQGNRKNRTEFSTVLDQKKRWISLCGGWREVGVLVLPRSNAFQFNAARSSEACQVAGAAGGYGGAERER